jgi:hypothetical protein
MKQEKHLKKGKAENIICNSVMKLTFTLLEYYSVLSSALNYQFAPSNHI